MNEMLVVLEDIVAYDEAQATQFSFLPPNKLETFFTGTGSPGTLQYVPSLHTELNETTH